MVKLDHFGIFCFDELVEWWVALAIGENASAFLGTQGYIGDIQSNMGYALFGGIVVLLVLSKLYDRQLETRKARE